jgi:hypothetical protein
MYACAPPNTIQHAGQIDACRGVTEMKDRRADIPYAFEELPAGTAGLKAYPDTNLACGRSKVNVRGNGKECDPETGGFESNRLVTSVDTDYCRCARYSGATQDLTRKD